jgi:hypothetical protein
MADVFGAAPSRPLWPRGKTLDRLASVVGTTGVAETSHSHAAAWGWPNGRMAIASTIHFVGSPDCTAASCRVAHGGEEFAGRFRWRPCLYILPVSYVGDGLFMDDDTDPAGFLDGRPRGATGVWTLRKFL